MSESSNYSLKEQAHAYGVNDALELPDWTGQVKRPSRVPNDEWRAYCRSNLPRLRRRPGHAEMRSEDGVPVEFHL